MQNNRTEIPITQIPGISIGQVEDPEAATGCTVLVMKEGLPAGLDIRGGGPASRETGLLDPLTAAQFIHAVVLAGGSAFGLEAANGVMQYLEEQGIGYDTGFARVPLVVQSDLYDLSVGSADVRPDRAMGYAAARQALEEPNFREGNFGAGCGASVGKICGMETAMKTGIGSFALQIGDLQVGAIAAVNALGDIYDWKTGEKIAGLLAEDKKSFRDTTQVLARSIAARDNKFVDRGSPAEAENGAAGPAEGSGFAGNTTLGVILTNAAFTKPQLCKIAGMAHDGYARSIRPVHTSADGDSIYAVAAGKVTADLDLVGILAAEVMSEAITRAVTSAESAYGLPAARDPGLWSDASRACTKRKPQPV